MYEGARKRCRRLALLVALGLCFALLTGSAGAQSAVVVNRTK